MKLVVWKLSRRHHLRDQLAWFFSVHASCARTDSCFRLSHRLVLRPQCTELSGRATYCPARALLEQWAEELQIHFCLKLAGEMGWKGEHAWTLARRTQKQGEVKVWEKVAKEKYKVRWRQELGDPENEWEDSLRCIGVRLEKTAAGLVSGILREFPGDSSVLWEAGVVVSWTWS